MIHFKNKYVLFIILIVLIIFSIYYFGKGYGDRLNTPAEITFSPKWVNQAQFAGIFIAKDLGYYSKNGLKVNVKEFALGSSVMDDLESGKAQLGLMSANEFLINVSEGKKITAVAAFFQVSPFMLASLRTNPVSSPTELKGKVLGIKGGPGAEGQIVYNLLLHSAGLKEEDATFKYLPFGDSEKQDLINGKVDIIGFYRDELYHFNQDQIAFVPIYPEQYGSSLYNDVLVVTDKFLAENPDVVKVFLKSTIDGWKYAYKHKEEALSVTMRYVTKDNYKDIDYERYILKGQEPLMTSDGSIEIGKMDGERWQRFYDVLKNENLLKGSFDVKSVFTNNYLPK